MVAMSDRLPVSPFARFIGAVKLGAGAVADVSEAARECLCLNCHTPLPVAKYVEDQDRLCKACRGRVVDSAANMLGHLVKRIW